MSNELLDLTNSRQTYRKILNMYWLSILCTVLLEYILHNQSLKTHNSSPVTPLILIQSACMMTVLGAAEWLFRYKRIQSDGLLVMTGILWAGSIIFVNPYTGIVPAVLILPIITSVMTFNKKRILSAYGMVLISFTLLYFFHPELRASLQLLETIGILFLYTAVAIIASAITENGNAILRHLLQANEAKQELLVKTIIMDKLSKMDALTDLYNHKTFHEYMDRIMELSEMNRLPVHLALIDIDDFKQINDTYGHWVGDIILTRVAAIIKESITSNDFIARYGGEEFAVIFTEKSPEQSLALAEEIRLRLSATDHPEIESKSVTVSIGMHCDLIADKEMLFKGADAALYRAKRTGKNQTVVYRGNKAPALAPSASHEG